LLPGEFEDLLEGQVPGTEVRLGRLREGEHDHLPEWVSEQRTCRPANIGNVGRAGTAPGTRRELRRDEMGSSDRLRQAHQTGSAQESRLAPAPQKRLAANS